MSIYSFRGSMPDYCVPNVYCAPHRIILMRRLATAEAAVLPAKFAQRRLAHLQYITRNTTRYSYAAAGDRWGSGPPSQKVSNVILTFWKRWISKKLHRAINRHKYAIFRLTQNACKRMNDEYSLLAIPLPAWFVNHSRAEEIIKPCCNLVMRLLRYCGKNPAEKNFEKQSYSRTHIYLQPA